MDALGYPQQLVDAEEVTKQDAFERVLIDVAIDLADLSSRYMEKVAEAEVTVRLVSGQKGRRCSGDGTILTTVSGTWSIRFVFEWLPRRQGGYGGTPYKGLPMQIEGTALMVEERDKEAVVEFSPQMISVMRPGLPSVLTVAGMQHMRCMPCPLLRHDLPSSVPGLWNGEADLTSQRNWRKNRRQGL